MFNTKLVALTIVCLFLASNCQLVSPFRAAQLLYADPPADNGHNKAGVGGSPVRRDGGHTGNTSHSGTMPPSPPTVAKYAYNSTNATVSCQSPHGSSTSTTTTITSSNINSPTGVPTNTSATAECRIVESP
ncbi:uncharacterized protein LOC116211902 [Punica granatum]|uniref:Uncharacterized protein n=2 Tax=Punica granatum TaxID=22663 RepID=A0A2I0I808_PUNGR|nr:uncharacterized protein LOC116211902 [Punica granatum]PKI40139.1 hypothetical protein CRG98_039469 [Punica granatum]